MKLLSERLKWAMARKSRRDGVDVLPADIARAAKVSDASASFWLNDANGVSAAKARLLADYLRVNPLWLESGVGAADTLKEAPPATDRRDDLRDVAILVDLYARSTAAGRSQIMDMAKAVSKIEIAPERGSSNNRS